MAEHKAKVDPIRPGQDTEGHTDSKDAIPFEVPPSHAPMPVFDDDSMFNSADPQAAALSPGKRGSAVRKDLTKSRSDKKKRRKAA
jgi:hypothetical protein